MTNQSPNPDFPDRNWDWLNDPSIVIDNSTPQSARISKTDAYEYWKSYAEMATSYDFHFSDESTRKRPTTVGEVVAWHFGTFVAAMGELSFYL